MHFLHLLPDSIQNRIENAARTLKKLFSYKDFIKQNGVTCKFNFRTSSQRHTCNHFKRFQNRRTAKAGERLP